MEPAARPFLGGVPSLCALPLTAQPGRRGVGEAQQGEHVSFHHYLCATSPGLSLGGKQMVIPNHSDSHRDAEGSAPGTETFPSPILLAYTLRVPGKRVD